MGTLRKLAWTAAGGTAAYLAFRAVAQTAEVQRNIGIATTKRIVILGAGFAGMSVAAELARLLPDEGNGEITLVDEDNFLLFTPMLTEAAGGELDPRHIAVSVRQLPPRVRFVQGVVEQADVQAKTVTVNVPEGPQLQLTADHLVIALGSVTNFHHVDGAEENAIQMKRLGDASTVCRRVLENIDRALVESDPAKRKALLTFVVAGGGYTGVETMAAVNDLLRDKAAEYGLAANEIRTVLVNPESRLLGETSPELAQYAAGKLKENGVEILMGKSVTAIKPDAIELKDGQRIPCRCIVWAAGVKPSPLVESLSCEKGKHGGITTDPSCQASGFKGVWALGDCAEIPQPNGSGTYAPIAQNATREGTLVARNILAQLRGEPLQPFNYKPLGELALVGKRSGVARVFGMNIHGSLAWAMWRAVYLAKIPGFRQKARVASDWILDVTLGRDAVPLGGGTSTERITEAAKA